MSYIEGINQTSIRKKLRYCKDSQSYIYEFNYFDNENKSNIMVLFKYYVKLHELVISEFEQGLLMDNKCYFIRLNGAPLLAKFIKEYIYKLQNTR